ncbi:hypothetical protein BT93_K1355 [Corymbia citriodora subsp. variegata]|nr:hypothetical protein BT93_K1355 [Corymbia citriodora subsp. variegata]
MSKSVFRILVLLVSLKVQASGAAPRLPKASCTKTCGNVTIPFPFGIGAGCFLDDCYEIVCPQNTTIPILNKTGLRVLNISLPNYREDMNGMISVSLPLIYSDASCEGEGLGAPVNLEGSPFVFSKTRNVFTSVGCNTLATVNSTESAVTDYGLELILQGNGSGYDDPFRCRRYNFESYASEMSFMQCYCRSGYSGNPYLTEGCQEKYFKRIGGLLLKGEQSSPEGNIEKSKLFNSKDLEKATDNFNDDRILGQGGQGTIYKGMLTDGKIVAIKKSKVIDEGKVEQFINEVLILSQINHRNTEVPLLVYEFIPNRTLYQYLHDPNQEFHVSWDTQLWIAIAIIGALFYLHSAASIPIYHRDIKSTNILLDEKYRAKVADFGTSKSVSLYQTHVTTLVQGTYGCLDPEYFQSTNFLTKGTRRKKPCNLFHNFMEENCLLDIVDAQVLKEGNKEEIASVANLAKGCLNLNGRNRPTMKEAAMELEGIRNFQNPSGFLQNQENGEATKYYDAALPPNKSNIDMDVITFSNVQPFLPSETW